MSSKKGEQGKSGNRIRFIMLDADISDGNLSELTQAITSALKPANGNYRQITPQASVKTLPATEETVEEADEPLDAEYEEPAVSTKAQKSSRPRKSKPPSYLHDLIKDSEGLKKFATEKAPASKTKQYLTAMYWVQGVQRNVNSKY